MHRLDRYGHLLPGNETQAATLLENWLQAEKAEALGLDPSPMPSYRLHLTHDPFGPDRYVDLSRDEPLKTGDTFPYEGTIWQVIDVPDHEAAIGDPGIVQCAPALGGEPGG
jgi:hypothetical protein